MLHVGKLTALLASLLSPSAFALIVPQASGLSQANVLALGTVQSDNMTLLELPGKVANLTGTFHCIPSSKLKPWTKRPSLRDCSRALRQLPSGSDIHTFSHRAMFPFQLPTDTTVGSCKASVFFHREKTSCRSSWTEIGLAALELALACKKGDDTGGNTTTGAQDLIEVKLEWHKDPDPDFATDDIQTS